jgi:hypothetical protein
MKSRRGGGGVRSGSKAICAACAAAAVTLGAGLRTESASAGLMVDVLALPGGPYSVSPDRKSVQASVGTTVTLGVYARISGTNAVQFSGDLDGDADAPDTRNDDSLDILVGCFRSIGPLLGNMNSVAGKANYNTRVAPFAAQGSENGLAADFDSDGDLDLGPAGNDPFDALNMWVLRSGAQSYAALFDGVTKGWVNGEGLQNPGLFGFNTEDSILDPTTAMLRVGTLRFIVSGGSGTAAVNFLPRTGTDTGTALWWEDGVATGKTPGTGLMTVGVPVLVTVPEPATAASLVVMGAASFGMTAQRKNRS